MIPAADRSWSPGRGLPLAGWHPATRLAAAVLTVLAALLLPWSVLVPLTLAVGLLLRAAGARLRALPGLLRAWAPVGAVVLAAHTISATDAAPLWHPSLTGLGRGALTLARLALMLATTGLAARLLPLGDLVAALAWWLRPLRPLGVDARHLGVTLAVALETAPAVGAEADRIAACLRLRRGRGRRRRWDLRGRLLAVPPLMEGLARRAETLPLALAGRVPEVVVPPLPPIQGAALLVAAALLTVAVI
jgi:energy-coupling factor transporter transmembrane protein EcfT